MTLSDQEMTELLTALKAVAHAIERQAGSGVTMDLRNAIVVIDRLAAVAATHRNPTPSKP